jgi:hypothetical protein
MKLLRLCCAYLLVVGTAVAAEPPAFPKYLPPVFGTAVAQKNDEFVELTITCPLVTLTAVAGVEDLEAPKLSTMPTVQADVRPSIRKITLRGPQFTQRAETEIVGLDGKPLSHQQILQRLASETPVLISMNRVTIGDYYLQTIKPDTLIVVLSYWDGAPATELFPHFAEKPPAETPARTQQHPKIHTRKSTRSARHANPRSSTAISPLITPARLNRANCR